MKKLIALLLALSLCLCLAGCGKKEEKQDPDGGSTKPDSSAFTFKAEDLDGNVVSFSDFSDAKLILVNMWEPWCGPCLAEMPDLEALYEKYSSDGFVIVGVFGNDSYDNARAVVKDYGITYPIVYYTSDFRALESGYVPTSAFFDAEGSMLNSDLLIGSMSYQDWEDLITGYLK